MKISIVYDSGRGHTAKQARAVAEGARRVPGTEVRLIAVADAPIAWDALAASDAIVFGSPTYNGSVSARFKQFMEDSTGPVWVQQGWRDKVAAGFTNSGTPNGDKLNSLITLALFAAQHGMLWVGVDGLPGRAADEPNRLAGWLGAMAQSADVDPALSPDGGDLLTAAHLGQRVATIAQRLRAQPLPTAPRDNVAQTA